jgi:phospholipid/cholesterol/gamma-HCH transport system ATP-binding protein
VLVFDRVSLAFDDKVILDEVSFELLPGRMKIILGASGAGKSTILRLILGLLRPDAGRIFVEGRRVDEMSEAELMDVRAEPGDGLPGRARSSTR